MVRKIWNIVTYIIVALAVGCAICLVFLRLRGFQAFSVLSGSMEPAYPTGSLIWVKPVDPAEIANGQVITFLLDADTVATHRVIEILPDEDDPAVLRFRTKGDSNNAADGGLVHQNNIIGTPVLTLPRMGYAIDAVRHPPGVYLAAAAGIVLLLAMFLPDMLRRADAADKAASQ